MHKDFRGLFQLNPDGIYFNAAYMTPMPITAAQAGVDAIARRTSEVAGIAPGDFFEASEKLRANVASLWGTLPRNVALVPSVSYGVETAVKNIRLNPGAEILVPAEDFPSNIYPWREAARASGARVETVPRPTDANWTRAFLERMQASTAVVSVPLSDWADGTKFDLRPLATRCREIGARFLVDVSQSFGAVPFAIGEFEPDFLFSVGYKWQLGPYGLSYLFASDRWLDGQPIENNWLNRKGSEDFSRLIEYRDDFQEGARRFDSGERSQFQLTPMALESTRLLREITIPAIFSHVNPLVMELHERLIGLGFHLPPAERLAGHMLGARHRNWPDMAPLVRKLKERGVFVSARGAALRISPHLYNDRTDVERFIHLVRQEVS